jgi:hypothetical protein
MIDNVAMAPSLVCIPIDCIVGPCIAITYNLNALTNEYFLFLKTRSEWPAIFVDVMKEGIKSNIIMYTMSERFFVIKSSLRLFTFGNVIEGKVPICSIDTIFNKTKLFV